MEPGELILQALKLGSNAVRAETASQAAREAYVELRSNLFNLLKGNGRGEHALVDYERNRGESDKRLAQVLHETGVDRNEAILDQANQLVTLLKPESTAQDQYNIQVHDSKGIAIGDGATLRISSKN